MSHRSKTIVSSSGPTVHRIFLRGPWDYVWETTSPADVPAVEGRARLPQTWQELFGEHRGRIRWTRRFNCPTNLTNERVLMTFPGIRGLMGAVLNDQRLVLTQKGPDSFTCEITALLRPSNLLVVEMERGATAAAEVPWGWIEAACLEIVSAGE